MDSNSNNIDDKSVDNTNNVIDKSVDNSKTILLKKESYTRNYMENYRNQQVIKGKENNSEKKFFVTWRLLCRAC